MFVDQMLGLMRISKKGKTCVTHESKSCLVDFIRNMTRKTHKRSEPGLNREMSRLFYSSSHNHTKQRVRIVLITSSRSHLPHSSRDEISLSFIHSFMQSLSVKISDVHLLPVLFGTRVNQTRASNTQPSIPHL